MPIIQLQRPKKTILPNVRKLFLPDPGYIMFDIDLVGADAAVAAKECGGEYHAAITAGRKINVEILEYCYPEVYKRWKETPPDPPGKEGYRDSVREPWYTKCKNKHYGTIYGGGPRGISAQAAIPKWIIERFQPWFFKKFPEIKGWHRRVEDQLYGVQPDGTINPSRRGVIRNAFGYEITYFDRLESVRSEAINWIPQSTVAIICQRGSLITAREFPDMQLRLQVHDSLVGQVPIRRAEERLDALLRRVNRIPVPYEDSPLYVPWGCKVSDKSWGHCIDPDKFFGRKAA